MEVYQDKVLETIKPDPDSQYRLCPCRCGSHNVAYVKYPYPDGPRWSVRCFDCGVSMILSYPGPRHDIQLVWNNWAKEETCQAILSR